MTARHLVQESVRAFYDRYPYPHYPILATPRWVDGYAASSLFARACVVAKAGTANWDGSRDKEGQRILVVGCGEILPYVIRRLEGRRPEMDCVDLSMRSIRRARFRMGLRYAGRTRFHCADIVEFLATQNRGTFNHVDAFGVLHHLADPHRAIRELAHRMAPGATMRVMVYNTAARRWIHHCGSALRNLGFSSMESSFVWRQAASLVRQILQAAGCTEILRSLAPTLASETRFVDTFLHVREMRASFASWYAQFAAAGLEALALFDRYGELDQLDNPFANVPTGEILDELATAGQFVGNLEIWWRKPELGERDDSYPRGSSFGARANVKAQASRRAAPIGHWRWQSVPRLPFLFPETRTLGLRERAVTWSAFRRQLAAHDGNAFENAAEVARRLPFAAAKRLARLGLFCGRELISGLNDPMAAAEAQPLSLCAGQRRDLPRAVVDACVNAASAELLNRESSIHAALLRLHRAWDDLGRWHELEGGKETLA